MTWFSDAISGMITNDFQGMIDDVVTNCQRACRIIYPITKYETDSTLGAQNQGDIPGSIFSHGMPGQFRDVVGNPLQAPSTDDRKPVITTEDVNLCVFYDERQWYPTSYKAANPDGMAQSFCSKDLTPKLLRAASMVFDTEVEEIYQNRFERAGGPEFCGWNSEYVIIMWKRVDSG